MKEILPFKTWEYKDHTKMKHQVFVDYFDKWVKIVGKYNKLNYIDGYAGIGAYKDQEGKLYFGSPVLAADTIQKNTSKLQRKVNLLVIDTEKDNLDNIDKIFNYQKLDIKPTFINNDFDKTINAILDNTQNLAPTFVFIDPFGFTIKIKTLKRIMQISKSEILLNFMFTRINQFLNAPNVSKCCNELFGGEEWIKCKKLKSSAREKCIIESYRNKLKKISKYVYYYRLEFPDMQKTFYYLFHLANHHLGCSIMKSSFAKFNYGRVEYRGNRNDQMGLFEMKDIKIEQVMKYLKNIYKGKQRTYEQIISEQIDETEFLESHFRKSIKEMENKELFISRIPPKTPTGKDRISIENQDIIVFKK